MGKVSPETTQCSLKHIKIYIVIVKTPADFIGSVIGESEKNTQAILESTRGKVLVIDEAYMLSSSTGIDGAGTSDPFRTAVVDTIVANVHNVPGDDRCILLLGYQDQMEKLFRVSNEGLSRRFPLSGAFHFQDFDQAQLKQILRAKLKAQDIGVTESAEAVAMDILDRARMRKNFGNAGEVANLLSQAIVRNQKRSPAGATSDCILQPEDLDPEHDRMELSTEGIRELFKDTVGAEETIATFSRIHNTYRNTKARKRDPIEVVPTNFRFSGPPGTGKTTTARKIGRIYYQMGLLASDEVIESSASNLVASYVGQTGPKTKHQLEKALGRVILIDEAYRLMDSSFGAEAINELVDLLTKPQFKGKIVVILAGYPDQMKSLFEMNPGLESRFPETINFQPLSPDHCIDLLYGLLEKSGMTCPELKQPDSTVMTNLRRHFSQLCAVPSWGNGRDVENIRQRVVRRILGADCPIDDDQDLDVNLIDEVLRDELSRRASAIPAHLSQPRLENAIPQQSIAPGPAMHSMTARQVHSAHKTLQFEADEEASSNAEEEAKDGEVDIRDPDVSDKVWNQLQADSQAEVQRERDREQALLQALKTSDDATKAVLDAEADVSTSQARVNTSGKTSGRHQAKDPAMHDDSGDNDDNELQERLRALEKARIALANRKAEQQRAEEARRELEGRAAEQKKKEAAAQEKLRKIGVCCAGFQWIRQSSGYRCAGGSHFVSHGQLDGMA